MLKLKGGLQVNGMVIEILKKELFVLVRFLTGQSMREMSS